jgi:toxin-antitoxin system PIN domain toxin
MFVVDTNILVYAANSNAPEYVRCRELLEAWRRQASPWYLTWKIVYEFLRVTTHPRVMPQPWNISQAWRFIEALLSSPALIILTETDRHAVVADEVFDELGTVLAGNLVHDAHTAVVMREHGIRRIYTRDADFHRFDFLEVVDPLRMAGKDRSQF